MVVGGFFVWGCCGCFGTVEPWIMGKNHKIKIKNTLVTFYLTCWGWMVAGRQFTMVEWWWRKRMMGDTAPVNHIRSLPAFGAQAVCRALCSREWLASQNQSDLSPT